MKNTLIKVWGIVLTLAILSGLLMTVVPVSAGDLSFTTATSPAVTASTNANVFGMAADGKTMYLYSGALYKSSDAGLTWVSTGLGTSLGSGITQIIVNQTNASELLATNGTTVYRSSNAGVSWYDTTPTNPTPASVTDIDESINGNGGVSILVSSPTDVYCYSTDTGTWLTTNSGLMSNVYAANSTTTTTPWAVNGVYGVAFSPAYANDNTLFALVNVGGVLYVRAYVVGGNYWNGDIADTAAPSGSTTAPIFVNGINAVSFAFPSGFVAGASSTGKIFVSYSNGSAGSVVRVNTKTQNTTHSLTSTVTDLQIGSVAPFSIAFTGAYNTGTLAVGLCNDSTVYSINGVGTATSNFSWVTSAQNPYNLNGLPYTKVVFSPTSTTLYAGTAGTTGSALSTSTDYLAFAAISFISTSGYANVTLDNWENIGTATAFQALFDNSTKEYLLFKSIDTGATWKLVYTTNALKLSIWPSPAFATDSTIYLTQTSNGAPVNKIVKSYDGGATWNTINVVGSLAPNAFAPIDGTNYWVATTAGIRASNSSTTVYLDGYSPIAIIGLPGCLLVWTAQFPASYGEWWASTDNGVTFNSLGANTGVGNGANGNFTFGYDGKNWTIYILDASMNIKMYTVGVSTAWTTYKTLPANPFISAAKVGAISNNGSVWYFSDTDTTPATTTTNPGIGIYRTTDFVTYQLVTGSNSIGNIVSKPALTIIGNKTTGANTIYTMVDSTFNVANSAYNYKWVTYNDIMLTAPATVAPAAAASITNNQNTSNGVRSLVDFSWKAVPNATKYEVQVANDAAFTDLVTLDTAGDTSLFSAGSSLSQVNLYPGRTYYWRVRVAANSPLLSYWSAGVMFSTVTSSSTSTGLDTTGRIYPTQGQVVTGTTITFTWGTVPGASSYEFNLIKDGTTVDVEKGLTSTVFTASNLAGNAQYTWQVRAISNGIASDWVTSAFTTVVPPVGTPSTSTAPAVQPTYTVIVPTQPAQPQPTVIVNVPTGTAASTSTPAWAWIVIAIGAVLVIAVIVLIVRTRRV